MLDDARYLIDVIFSDVDSAERVRSVLRNSSLVESVVLDACSPVMLHMPDCEYSSSHYSNLTCIISCNSISLDNIVSEIRSVGNGSIMRLHHFPIVGGDGSGKTTMMKAIIKSCVEPLSHSNTGITSCTKDTVPLPHR